MLLLNRTAHQNRRFIGLLLCAVAVGPAHAESSVSADFTTLKSSLDAVQAKIPKPCGSVPQADTLLGSVGSTNCFSSASDTRPTVVQAGFTTTAADGSWSITWAKPFATANPWAKAEPMNVAGQQPMTCNVATSTATGATGRCWMQNVMTTPGVSLSLLNLQLVGAAASIQVRVAGRDLTQ